VRTRALFASVTVSLGILVAGLQMGAQNVPAASAVVAAAPATSSGTTTSTAGTTSGGTASTGTTSAGSTATATPSAAATPAAGSSTASGTFTGTTTSERYGSVTVKITVANGTITDVAADSTVGDSRSQQIETRAESALRTAVLTAQSANVSMISGATYTSEAYLTSLQSALDQVKL